VVATVIDDEESVWRDVPLGKPSPVPPEALRRGPRETA
jgi:hypothetical protein